MGIQTVAKSFSAFMTFVLLGLFAAILLGELYERGIIIDEFVTGSITLTDLMFLTFFLFLLAGTFVACFIGLGDD